MSEYKYYVSKHFVSLIKDYTFTDEKEEGILGSILLPSFQISVLSAEDHINRKYAFKVRESIFQFNFMSESTIA